MRASASMKRGLTPSGHAGMQCPLPVHTLAHLAEISGPAPVRTMSITPDAMASGSDALIPAGPGIGHTSTHLPHRVQSLSVASRRASNATRNSCDLSNIVSSPFGVLDHTPIRRMHPSSARSYIQLDNSEFLHWVHTVCVRARAEFRNSSCDSPADQIETI